MDDFNIHDLWPKISPALKRRWWSETDYGRLEPSEDLKTSIREDIAFRALGAPGYPKLK